MKLLFIVSLVMILQMGQAKIPVEETKFWPIREPVEIEEVDRVGAFKKLNIGLGIQR
jgi:hypothetical protein